MNFMFSLVGLLIAYYFMFWAFMCHKPLRRLRKIYRVAFFILGCYWALFLFWVCMQIANSEYLIRYQYERISSFVSTLIESCISSLFFSGLFLLAVYIYQHYVEQEE